MPEYDLLNVGRNAKTLKSDKMGEWLTGILYLTPGNKAGKGYDVCPSRSAGCEKACLYTSGMGNSTHVRAARIRKTRMFFDQRDEFMNLLMKDLTKLVNAAYKTGRLPAVRLNGTSDIEWEKVVSIHPTQRKKYLNIMEAFPEIQFYDYTKIPGRNWLPENYHLTFSLAEDNLKHAVRALKRGRNVSAVFPTKKLPKEFLGYEVINGDKHDLRFLDPSPVIVGVSAKAEAKNDVLGFVQRV